MDRGKSTESPARRGFHSLESILLPRFDSIASMAALTVLVTLVIGQVWQEFDDFMRPLYVALTLLIVIEILRRLLAISGQRTADTEIVQDQQHAIESLVRFIEATSFRGEVKILAYAGSALDHLLSVLAEAGVATVKVLVCQPESAMNATQAQRILAQVDQRRRTLRGVRREERYYRSPPTMRGFWLEGGRVAIGWYTYEALAVSPDQISPAFDLHGPSNVMVIADPRTKQGRLLSEHFEKTFEDLWVASNPEPPTKAANH